MNRRQLITWIYLAVFGAVAVWAGLLLLEMQRELTVLRGQMAATERRLEEARQRLATQEKYLHDLRHDPALVERVIRRKLGYARAEEFIFRFEDRPTTPP